MRGQGRRTTPWRCDGLKCTVKIEREDDDQDLPPKGWMLIGIYPVASLNLALEPIDGLKAIKKKALCPTCAFRVKELVNCSWS